VRWEVLQPWFPRAEKEVEWTGLLLGHRLTGEGE
jgi:hypothetical protein